MMTFARSRNIETVGELLLLRRADLLLAPGIGVKTIEGSAAAITQWMKVVGEEGVPPLLQANGVPPEFRIQVFDDFGSLWTSRVSALSSTDRLVVSRRSGISAAAETLARIGEDLGVTRERVRQIEARALEELKADGRWIDALSEKLSAAREGRARASFSRTLVGILEEAGEPRGFGELRRRLEERVTVPELALLLAVTQPPLLRLAVEPEPAMRGSIWEPDARYRWE